MTLLEVKDLFKNILPGHTHHYTASGEKGSYIVWAEEGQSGAKHANNKMQEQALEGTVDLFTKTEYDPLFNQVQQAMNSADMTWRLNSIQHEEDTKYIHYEWVWQVVNPVG